VPGFPHPFIPDLLAAEEKDQWSCAAGFKFAGPVNPQNVECIDQNVGLTGMTLSTKPTTPFAEVAGITAGWPAAEAGIAAGTYIVSVDGVSTDGLTTAAVIARIRGNMGATVRLGIVAPGAAPRVVVLTRR
jgi:C-terminal processing protease CtpA/Prc